MKSLFAPRGEPNIEERNENVSGLLANVWVEEQKKKCSKIPVNLTFKLDFPKDRSHHEMQSSLPCPAMTSNSAYSQPGDYENGFRVDFLDNVKGSDSKSPTLIRVQDGDPSDTDEPSYTVEELGEQIKECTGEGTHADHETNGPESQVTYKNRNFQTIRTILNFNNSSEDHSLI